MSGNGSRERAEALEIVPIAGHKKARAALYKGQCSESIVLDFKQPIRMRKRLSTSLERHGPEIVREHRELL